MRRREFITLLGGTAVAWPLGADAQPIGKFYRVGWILPNAPVSEMAGPDPVHLVARAFVHALRDLGYVQGRNLVLERRSAEGRYERYGEIVAELVQRKVDVIVTVGTGMTLAAKLVTSTVPIVMVSSQEEPVLAGLVASLARPGGNITGSTLDTGVEFEARRLQMLKEAHPTATRVACFGTKSDWEDLQGKHLQATASILGLTLVHAELDPTHYAGAFAGMIALRPHAIFASANGTHYINRQLIADFALDQRLPGMFWHRETVEAGGLMSYGASLNDMFRRAAGHVDKILKGAKPADLPVEQPTKFELVINLKTAKAIGFTVPPALLARADEVIE